MEDILSKIKDYADNAHGEQMRKYTPDRYIVHPIRVMETLRNYTDSLPVLAAALLHDVLEDTSVTEADLLSFLTSVMDNDTARHTLHLVVEMTDVYVKADYPELNRKARKEKELQRIVTTGAEAQTIKYADILDNSAEIAEHDKAFAKRFFSECHTILLHADKGNPELRTRALTTVKQKLKL